MTNPDAAIVSGILSRAIFTAAHVIPDITSS
jgi:hypothetical protein